VDLFYSELFGEQKFDNCIICTCALANIISKTPGNVFEVININPFCFLWNCAYVIVYQF